MSDTQTIKDRIDIVQLMQEYIQLKKSGVNWKGCCPFHQEKTPSLMVHPERQFFHCFGCSESGDVFSFIQKIEGLEFPEALKLLADRAGVKLDTFRSEINKSQKNRIMEINQKAEYFFHRFLLDMPASTGARDYLKNRGLSAETITEWKIGFIPDQWELLTQYLLKKGCGIEDIALSGLAIKKDNANAVTGLGYYDRFRGRIMFPIWDVHNNVVGFTARILVERENSGGKYINTPQTLVYDKSRILFGLNKAKMEIKNNDRVILVEGQMDVIAVSSAGMKNVVASSGTALTIEQVKLLKRYTNNISMAFDADEAGVKAAKRGIDVALEQGMNIQIIQIPPAGGKDADDCIRKDKKLWFDAVKNATGVMEWYFDINLRIVDLQDPKSKQQAAENILREIARIPYAIERDHWLKELSNKLAVSVSTLREEMDRLIKLDKKRQFNQGEDKIKQPEKTIEKPKNRFEMDLETLWAIFLSNPQTMEEYFEKLRPEYFTQEPYITIYETALSVYNKDKENLCKKLENELNNELSDIVGILVLKGEKYFSNANEKELKRELEILLERIESEHRKQVLLKQV